jgi:signal transduction histidine kinase/ActR/RegA family two-component response regulator
MTIRWTIKRKLLALIGGTLLSLLSILFFWVRWEAADEREQAMAELGLWSGQAGSQVAAFFQHTGDHLRVLAWASDLGVDQPDALHGLLAEVPAKHQLTAVFLVRSDGTPVAAGLPGLRAPAVSAADSDWFRRVQATGRPAVSGLLTSAVTGQPTVIVALPVPRPAARAVVVAALNPGRLHALFEPLSLPPGVSVTVVDAAGRVLTHVPSGDQWLGRFLPASATLPHRAAVVAEVPWPEGGPQVVAVTPVAGTDWRGLVALPQAVLWARVQRQARRLAIPVLGLLAGSGLVGVLLARRIWEPLQALRRAVTALARTGSIVPVRVDSTDEVGELTRTFNAMAVDVAEARAGLERQLAELAALQRVGHTVASTLDLAAVLSAVAESSATLLGARRGAVFELDPRDQRLHARAVHGFWPEPPLLPMPLGFGAAGTAGLRREPVYSPDIETDPLPGCDEFWEEAGTTLREVVRRRGHRAILAVPLLSKDAVLGVICVYWDQPHARDECEVRLLTAFSQQAAVAVENARLVKALRRTLEELTAAQKQLVDGERLRAMGELTAGIAHHLNNLLAVVLGRVQLDLERTTDATLRNGLEVIERTTREAAEVVRRVRRFAAIQPACDGSSVDLNALAADVVTLTRPRWQDEAQRRGALIEVALEPGAIPASAGTPDALREVLLNLVLNAVDALPGGGRIIIRTWATDGMVHCAVTDTGVGMPEEVRRHALEPFFTTKGPRRTGLGLSVTHGILQRYSGSMELDSAAGRGTTVTLHLPPALAPSVVDGSAAPALPPLRILVVDDETELRELLAERLVGQGHVVAQAASGAEALARFRTEHPDLVLTDLGMPGMTGREVAEAIKAASPTTPVVLLTGWGDRESVEAAEARGMDAVLSKPFELTQLVRAVAQAMSRTGARA